MSLYKKGRLKPHCAMPLTNSRQFVPPPDFNAAMIQSSPSRKEYSAKLASIDEDEEDPMQPIVLPHNTLVAHHVGAENLRKWKQLGRVTLNETTSASSLLKEPQEEAEVFQSETTLLDSQQEIHLPPNLNAETPQTIKSKIANFLQKPMERFYGKQEEMTRKEGKNKAPTDQSKQKKEDEDRVKSPSLLKKIGKLGHKIQSFRPFSADPSAPLLKKTKFPSSDTSLNKTKTNLDEDQQKFGFYEDDEKQATKLTDSEYTYVMKSRKLFESRYKVSFQLLNYLIYF